MEFVCDKPSQYINQEVFEKGETNRIQEILNLSELCRQIPDHYEETAVNKEVFPCLRQILINLDQSNNLEDATYNLASALLNNPCISVVMIDGDEKGLSGNNVFLINDAMGTPQLVVKALTSEQEFLREIFGIRFLRDVNSEIAHGVNFIDGGSYQRDSSHYILLAMTPAKGSIVSSQLAAISKEDGVKRQRLVDVARNAINLFGQALGDLHLTNKNAGPVPPFLATRIAQDFESGLNSLREKPPEEMNLEALEKKTNNLKNKILGAEISLGSMHFDANPNNVFVDLKERDVTFIDVAGICLGETTAHKSAGLISYDWVHARLQLLFRMNKYALSVEEQTSIDTALTEGYQISHGQLPSSDEEKFFTAWEALRVLGKFWTGPSTDADRQERIKILLRKLREIEVSTE